MYPDAPYAEGRGSFLRPVPLPHYGPSAEPTKTIIVACEWLPYIRGALQQLLLQTTWATDNPVFLTDIQGNVFNLIDLFSECPESELPFTCDYDFTLSDGAWVNIPRPLETPTHQGDYVAGGGWFASSASSAAGVNVSRGIIIKKLFSPAVSMRHMGIVYDLVKGSFSFGGNVNAIAGYSGVTNQFLVSVPSDTDTDGMGKTLTWDGAAVLVDQIVINIIVGVNTASTDPGGSCNVYRAGATGTGSATSVATFRTPSGSRIARSRCRCPRS